MNRITVSLGLLALGVSVPVSAQEKATEKKTFDAVGEVKTIDVTDRRTPPPFQPLHEQVELSSSAPDGIAAPAGSHDPRFAVFSVGSRKVAAVVAKSTEGADKPDAVWIDLDADGKLGDAEKVSVEVSEQKGRDGSKVLVGRPAVVKLAAGSATVPAAFQFSRQGEEGGAVLIFTGYLAASVQVGDEERVIAVLDKDLDGAYGGAKDVWLVVQPGGRPASEHAMAGMMDQQFAGGHRLGITVSDQKVQVTAVEAEGPDPQQLAAQRARVEHEWFERFAKDREQFIAQKGLDTSRPTAETPIPWNYVTFDQGLALAKESGKPLFVDVMAFWCVWCYALDYYTYPDKEVAELLTNQFVPMKLIQEQDPAGDYERVSKLVEARGIPAMGIVDGDGKVLHKIGGWKKPEDFVAELKKGLEARPSAEPKGPAK